jgi:hypothetical protein
MLNAVPTGIWHKIHEGQLHAIKAFMQQKTSNGNLGESDLSSSSIIRECSTLKRCFLITYVQTIAIQTTTQRVYSAIHQDSIIGLYMHGTKS